MAQSGLRSGSFCKHCSRKLLKFLDHLVGAPKRGGSAFWILIKTLRVEEKAEVEEEEEEEEDEEGNEEGYEDEWGFLLQAEPFERELTVLSIQSHCICCFDP